MKRNWLPGAGLAVHLDRAAHPMRELLADGEPQADAGLALAPLLRLLERGEDAQLVLRRDAHAGVLDADHAAATCPSPQGRPARSASRCPASVNLIALPSRFRRICRMRLPSARTSAGRSCGMSRTKIEPFLLRIDAHHRRDLLQQRGQLNRRRIQLEVAGTDARQSPADR